jgi:hypothetical protein
MRRPAGRSLRPSWDPNTAPVVPFRDLETWCCYISVSRYTALFRPNSRVMLMIGIEFDLNTKLRQDSHPKRACYQGQCNLYSKVSIKRMQGTRKSCLLESRILCRYRLARQREVKRTASGISISIFLAQEPERKASCVNPERWASDLVQPRHQLQLEPSFERLESKREP